MEVRMTRLNLLATTALIMTLSAPAHGQSMTGATGDDSRTVLPRSATPFAGQIGQTWQQSRPDFPKPLVAPEGAPNVLLILTDDTGFGHASTFGGGAATPVLERLARDGLRYNRFHTTALCSPTRAALLTGRNHHSVGTGVIMEMGTGYPGYTGIVPNSAVGVPEILRLNGYATGCFGKWHNTPATEVSAAGPFERWPTGSTWGCDTFYGFMAGETDQYYPVLYRNTTPLNPPRTPEQGYSFSEDMADETIGWINNVSATDPKKPWFVYLATPGVHEPHQAPKEYRDKYKGKFDAGWDKYREETIARQKRLGVVPADAKLSPLPKEVPAWESLSQDAKRVYARMMENYSAYLEYTDAQIGRVIDAIAAKGQLDLPGLLGKYADIGGPETEPNIPVGWAIAADTPFQWTKQVASHFGGTRNPMVINWPKRIRDKGGLRSQFLHCIDVVPTILQAVGLPQPRVVNGVQQKPIEGVTFLSTF